jgi:thiamine biosynthesis lipoprotein
MVVLLLALELALACPPVKSQPKSQPTPQSQPKSLPQPQSQASTIRLSGRAMGMTYHILYDQSGPDSSSMHNAADSVLTSLTHIFSTYDSTSVLSQINSSRDVSIRHVVGKDFAHVYKRSEAISDITDGAFNPASGPLTAAWRETGSNGFLMTDSLLQARRDASGFSFFAISDDAEKTLTKRHAQAALDFNGIAKGYAVDQIATFFLERGVRRFLVELGGEIRTSGTHPDGRDWQIAIERPISPNADAQAVISISDVSVATSGNYRTSRFDGDSKIVHIIDPASGRPAFNDLLSVTVIAEDCMTADAFATALMVMGSEKAVHFLTEHSAIDAYLIIGKEEQAYEIYATPGFKKRLIE